MVMPLPELPMSSVLRAIIWIGAVQVCEIATE